MVISARDHGSPESAVALNDLCRAYWHPLYAFARRQGMSAHDAQDATQAFFGRFLEKDLLKAVAPEKGRFRSFLLVAFKRFLANEREREHAQKRGGGVVVLSLDANDAESRYQPELRDDASAEVVYQRRWALTLLDRTLQRLRAEFVAAGKAEDFDRLKSFLTGAAPETSYAEVAVALGVSAGAARVAAHRLRRRFRDVFRDEIAHTVADASDVDDEVRELLGILAP